MSKTLSNFLKDQDTVLHKEYIMERYRKGTVGLGSNIASPKIDITKPVFIKDKFKIDLENIASLNKSHPARIYLEQSREIAGKILENLYYCKILRSGLMHKSKRLMMLQMMSQESSFRLGTKVHS